MNQTLSFTVLLILLTIVVESSPSAAASIDEMGKQSSTSIYYMWMLNRGFQEMRTPLPKHYPPLPRTSPSMTTAASKGAACGLSYGIAFGNRRSVGAFHHPANSSSTAQCDQDLIVLDLLDGRPKQSSPRFFVDLASNHYRKLSNTYSLERNYNWNGICVEPNPLYRNGLLSHRLCKLVVSPVWNETNYIIKFVFSEEYSGVYGLSDEDSGTSKLRRKQRKSSMKSEYSVLPTVTLLQILEFFRAPNTIDYLSLDVEGSEFQVLQNFDFSSYVFNVITIERPSQSLHLLLTRNKYWIIQKLSDFGEVVYVHESLPDFHRKMMKFRSRGFHSGWTNEHHQYLFQPRYSALGEYVTDEGYLRVAS